MMYMKKFISIQGEQTVNEQLKFQLSFEQPIQPLFAKE